MIPNIGPRERRKRLRFGAIFFGSGVIAAGALMVGAAPRAWRITVFLPFWLAALGYFQARDKT